MIMCIYCGYLWRHHRIVPCPVRTAPIPVAVAVAVPIPIPSPGSSRSSAHGSENSGHSDPLGRMTVSTTSRLHEDEEEEADGADEEMELEEPASDSEFSDVDMGEPYNKLKDRFVVSRGATM